MDRMKSKPTQAPSIHLLWLISGWAALILLAYGTLLLHPSLHTACPENDTWNFPIRWSVLSSLREGRIPLWNSLLAFGIPWLATWQTETFYPGTLLFVWKGLEAWNFSGILHLLIFSSGVYTFLRASKVGAFWSFFSAAIALLNACAFNHLGSNSSMDTMAWMPWMFLATRECVEGKPFGTLKWALFLALQVFAGYPQIIFYTLAGCAAFAIFLASWNSPAKLLKPLGWGLLFSAAQWMPSIEYFLFNSVRLPAVSNNPHFFLPLENLETFFNWNALAGNGVPDYVNSPTFFYFNFYSGIVPLLVLAAGVAGFKRLKKNSLFFLGAFLFVLMGTVGFLIGPLLPASFALPSFLEPAKAWVLVNLMELFALGFLLEDLVPNPGKWKWVVLSAGVLNLLYPIWIHPYEHNFTPPHETLERYAREITGSLGSGRVLILPNEREHQALYTPLPDPGERPFFKHFVPDSNLYVSLPLANFYGSTWPSWGALDANQYFKLGFPYGTGKLLDLLGVDLLVLPEDHMPPNFRKKWKYDVWVLWKNPSSLGGSFTFIGQPQVAGRRDIFSAFASGTADPRRILYLDPAPVSKAPLSFQPPLSAMSFQGEGEYRVITQNAMPGWRAWVDGKPQHIYTADGIFVCVPILKHSGQVQISYEPTSFRMGLFISLLFWGWGLGWSGFLWGRLKPASN